MLKVFLLILDGLGDRPIEVLGGRTPLEAAKTPHLDELAKKGITGVMHTLGLGIKPGSDTAHLAILGYDPQKYYTGRGPFEVAGLNMTVEPGDVCLRVNMGTVDDELKVIDRRAGRIDDTGEFAKLFDGTEIEGVRFNLKKGTQYRLGLVLRGKGISAAVTDGDPKEVGKKVKLIEPKDGTEAAKLTAKVLNQFLGLSYEKLRQLESNKQRKQQGQLEANYFLLRGAGVYPKIPSFEKQWGLKAVCVAGAGLYKGIARVLGMKVEEVEGATGKPDSNLEAKIERAIAVSEAYDLVFVHIKAADSLGEDGNVEGKKQFIEKIDKAVKPLLGLKNSLVVVTADHSTPCELKGHSGDEVPVVMTGEPVRPDKVAKFSERDCADGGLGHVKGLDVMPIIRDLLGRAEKFGA